MNRAQMLAHLELNHMELVLPIGKDEYYSSLTSLIDVEDDSTKVEQNELSYYGHMYKHRVGKFEYYHFVSMRKVGGYPELESEAFYKEPYISTEERMKDFQWILDPLES